MGGGGGYRPYGRDALTAGPVHEYDFSPDYHPSSEQQEALPFYDSQERKYFLLLFLYKEKCRPFFFENIGECSISGKYGS